MSADMTTGRGACCLLSILAPTGLVAYYATFSRFTRALHLYLDYWGLFPSMLGPDGFVIILQDLYLTSNEHIFALTTLFYLLNYAVTHGNNFGLSLIA